MRSTARRAVVGACMVLWAAAASAQTALGFEYLHSTLTSGTERVETKGQQVALSALYTF